MADAYKGLTIRIGGDTSRLSKALRSSNAAIRETQGQLRKLNSAAKLDPSNASLLTTKLETMNEKARALTNKLHIMKDAWKQVTGSSNVRNADVFENAALNAKRAEEAYAKVVEQLARIKREAAEAHGETEKVFDGLKDSGSIIAKMREIGVEEEKIAQYAKKVDEYLDKLAILDVMKTESGLKRLAENIQLAESEAKQLYRTIAHEIANAPLNRVEHEFDSIRTSITQARDKAELLKTALKYDPENLSIAKARLLAMREELAAATKQAQRARDEINKLGGAARLVKLRAEIGDIAEAEKQAKERAAELGAEIGDLQAKLRNMPDEEFRKVGSEANRAKERVDTLEDKLAEVNTRLHHIGEVKAFNQLEREALQARTAVGRVNAELEHVHSRFSRMSGSIQQLGWSMMSTISPAMTMFAYRAIDSAEEVDQAYRNMRKTVQGTEEQFEHLRAAALEYSTTHWSSASDILEIEAIGGQLGIAQENLEAFATTVSNLDIATNLDTETAATELGQLSGILNDMSEKDFDRFGDALVRLGNNAPTLESNIMNVTKRIASMGTISGFTTPQLMGIATAVAATGQGSEAAGTAIQRTMGQMESAINSGGDALEAWTAVARHAGGQSELTAEQFQQMWNTDPYTAFKLFIQGLKGIEEEGGSASDTLGTLGINAQRQRQTLLGLTQTVDDMDDYVRMANDAWNGMTDEFGHAGDAANEADKKMAGFSGDVQKLRNNFQVLAVEVGDSLAPVLDKLVDIVSAFVQGYSKLPQSTKLLIDALVGIGAAAGPVLVAVNAITRAFYELSGNSRHGYKAMREASKEMKGFRGAASSARGEAMAMSGAVGTMGTNAQKATGRFNSMKTALKGIGKTAGMLAIVAILAEIAYYIYDVIDANKKWKQSNEDLFNAQAIGFERYNSALKDAKKGFEGASYEGGNYQDVLHRVAEANSTAAEEISQTWKEFYGQTGTLDKYKATLDEIIGSTEESEDKNARLRLAIDNLNSVLGTSYEYCYDAEQGYMLLADGAAVAKEDVDKLIESMEEQMRLSAFTRSYEAAAEAAADLRIEYNGVKGEIEQLQTRQREISQLKNNNPYMDKDQLNSLNAEYRGNAVRLSILNDELGKVSDSYASAESEAAFYEQQMYNSAYAMENASYAAEDLVSANDAFAQKLKSHGIDTFVAQLNEMQGELEEAGISIEDLANLTPEQLDFIAESYDGTSDSIRYALEQLAKDTPELGWSISRGWASGLSTGTADAVRAAAELCGMTEEEFVKLANDLGIRGDAAMKEFAESIKNSPDPEQAAKLALKKSDEALAATNAKVIGKATMEAFAAGISSITTPEKNATASRNKVVSALSFTSSANSQGAAGAGGFAAGISNNAWRAANAASGLSKTASNSLSSLYGSGYSVGSGLAEGLAAGVRGNEWRVRNAVNQLANVAASGINAALRINSPSKVFMETGAGVVEGFVLGIDSNAYQAVKSVTAMAQNTIRSARSALNADGTMIHAKVAAEVAAMNRQGQVSTLAQAMDTRLAALESKYASGGEVTYNATVNAQDDPNEIVRLMNEAFKTQQRIHGTRTRR